MKSITLNDNEVAVIWTVDYMRSRRPDFTVDQARQVLHTFAIDYEPGEQDWATLDAIQDEIARNTGLPSSDKYWDEINANTKTFYEEKNADPDAIMTEAEARAKIRDHHASFVQKLIRIDYAPFVQLDDWDDISGHFVVRILPTSDDDRYRVQDAFMDSLIEVEIVSITDFDEDEPKQIVPGVRLLIDGFSIQLSDAV